MTEQQSKRSPEQEQKISDYCAAIGMPRNELPEPAIEALLRPRGYYAREEYEESDGQTYEQEHRLTAHDLL